MSDCTSAFGGLNALITVRCFKRNCLHEHLSFADCCSKCMHILKNNKIMVLKLTRVFLSLYFCFHVVPRNNAFLTIVSQCQRCRRTQNSGICHCVFYQAYITANIRCLHLGDVEIACLLRDEASAIFCHKRWEFIKYPAIDDL